MRGALHYRAYDLAVDSEIPLPELVPWRDDGRPTAGPRVVVRVGRVPRTLDGARVISSAFQVRSDAFVLHIEGVASYSVRDGREITVEPATGASEHEVRVFLLGTCMGGLLHQRGYLVLHASAVADDRGATLMCGHSGSGKSTLLGALLDRGHRMLVDDVCAITIGADDRPVAHPAYPRTRLWADAARELDRDTRDLPRVRPDMDKFEWQVPERFWDTSAVVRRVFLLTSTDRDDLRLEPLSVVERFAALVHHTYRRTFIDTPATRRVHFDLTAAVASAVPVIRVTRPRAPVRLDELADMIERELLAEDAERTPMER